LKELLNQEENLGKATLNQETDYNSGKSQDDVPDHEEYAEAILDTEEIDRAHCEVSLFTE